MARLWHARSGRVKPECNSGDGDGDGGERGVKRSGPSVAMRCPTLVRTKSPARCGVGGPSEV